MKVSNWEKFDKAFNQVSAYVVFDQDTMQPIAKIALKFPKDAASRLHGFIHIIGMEVQHAFVGGYGYDKRTAVITKIANNIFSNIEIEKQNISTKQKQFLELLTSEKAQGGWEEVICYKNAFVVIQAV